MALFKKTEVAARTEPCRTPEEMENASEIIPFTLITLWVNGWRVFDDVNKSWGYTNSLKNVPVGFAVRLWRRYVNMNYILLPKASSP